MACKDCIHYYPCQMAKYIETNGNCVDFIDKSKYKVVPCDVKIGDKVYEIIHDDELPNGVGVCEQTVTEVGQKHIWVSAYEPPEDDIFSNFPIDKIGKTIFLTREEAEKAIMERE